MNVLKATAKEMVLKKSRLDFISLVVWVIPKSSSRLVQATEQAFCYGFVLKKRVEFSENGVPGIFAGIKMLYLT
jgi:hypothetical protein